MTFATALPPLNVVTVTLETAGFFGAAFLALVFLAGFAAVDLETVVVLGIDALLWYSYIINPEGLTSLEM